MTDPKANPAADTKAAPTTPPAEEQATPPADVVTSPRAKTKAKPVVRLNECVVYLARNELTKIPVTVFEHEVPVLIAVHGDDKVQIVETYEVEIEGFSVVDEYERLKRRYNTKATPEAVTKAFPMGLRQLAGDLGVKVDESEARKKAAASQQEGTARTTQRKAK